MTGATTSKTKYSLIRAVLTVAGMLLVGFVARGWLMAHSAPNSALATTGSLDIAAMLVVVGVVFAVVVLAKLAGRKRR